MRVEDHLQRWQRAGLLTPEQAERIAEHERAAGGTDGSARSRVVEALGYLGGSLALVALFVLVQDFWADLEVWAQAGLLVLLAGLLLAAGAALRSSAEGAIERLAGVLWLLSSAALAFAVGVIAADALGWRQAAVVATAGAVTAVYAGVLWRLRPSALQLVSSGAAVLAAVVGGLQAADRLVDVDLVGLVVWGVGVVWALLTWGHVLRPPRSGYALGALGALGGAQALAFSHYEDAGHALGLATAVALVAASVAVGEVVLLGLGAVGVVVFVSEVVVRYVGDALGVPLALFVVGLALVGVAVVIGRLHPRVERSDD